MSAASRSALLLLPLVGCNWVYGIGSTEQLDAQYFDAAIDAPFACPDLGVAPAFAQELHLFVLQDCTHYNVTRGGHAVASCRNPEPSVFEGPVGELLAPAVGIPTTTNDEFYERPRISPDGERLLVRHADFVNLITRHHYYARTPSGTWQPLADPPFADAIEISSIANGATGYLVLAQTADQTFHEWVDEGGTWRELRTHSPAAFGIDPIRSVAITADGLRALVTGGDTARTFYSDRPGLQDTFRAAVAVDGIAFNAQDGYMTEDCSRMYLTGLGYVFFAQQR